MKLYYSPGSCALAPHIVLAELDMKYELESVNLGTKVMASGGDFREVNPKGSVPALKLGNGEILTEGSVINQFLADQNPAANLLPKFGTQERYRCLEWLNFIGSEIHKTFSPLFGAQRILKDEANQNEMKNYFRETLKTKISLVSNKLGSQNYLMGQQFTIADAYLFTVLRWAKPMGIDLAQWANIASYMKRVEERPAVKKALQEQGLLK